MTKRYPDQTLEKFFRARGINPVPLWAMRGADDTGIAWMAAYAINGVVVIVQTYNIAGGWDAYTPSASNSVDDKLNDVMRRCGIDP